MVTHLVDPVQALDASYMHGIACGIAGEIMCRYPAQTGPQTSLFVVSAKVKVRDSQSASMNDIICTWKYDYHTSTWPALAGTGVPALTSGTMLWATVD